ncbi:MAG: hypothetical protein JKY14_07130, partial [Paraglaciecola sp.]|nr:hypothetical protein [Paraglaciecola sp.]
MLKADHLVYKLIEVFTGVTLKITLSRYLSILFTASVLCACSTTSQQAAPVVTTPPLVIASIQKLQTTSFEDV